MKGKEMKLHNAVAVLAVASLTLVGCASGETGPPPSTSAASDCKYDLPSSAFVEEGTLTYSTNATLPPMQYLKDGEIVGMRVELAEKIAQELCVEIKPVNVPFESQIPGLQGKRWDMMVTGMFYRPERAEVMNLIPYEVQGVAISVPSENPLNIQTVDDLSGKVVAVQAPAYESDTLDAINEDFINRGLAPMDIRGFQTYADAYGALGAGQVEALAVLEAVTTYYEDEGRFASVVHGLNIAPLTLGIAKENKVLADAVVLILNDLKASGWLDELMDRYQITAYDGPIEIIDSSLTFP